MNRSRGKELIKNAGDASAEDAFSSPASRTAVDSKISAASYLAAIIESSDDAIISKNLNGVITSWNQGAERVFGYSADEIVGRSVSILIPPERLDEEEGILKRIRNGERVEHYETVRRRKDGSSIDVSLTVSPIKGTNGKIVGASKIARDITQQRRDRERLRRSEERFRVTLASIGDGVIATDTQGRVTFMNVVAEKLTGWCQQDALGLPLENSFRILHEITRQPVENPVTRVLREGIVVGLGNHTTLISRDGNEHPIADSAAPIRDARGEMTGVVLVFRDATAEREAKLVARRLAAIIENTSDAIFTKDLNGVIRTWNKGAERIFGFTPEEAIDKPIAFIPEDRTDEERAIIARIENGESILAYETTRLTKDGREIPVSLSASPLRDPATGRVVGMAKIARDITEIKKAKEAAVQTAAKLEALVAERTAYLQQTIAELEGVSYSLSHDMRAPLRTIHSFSEIVLTEAHDKLSSNQRELLQKSISAAARLDRLIQDVLTYSRVSREAIEFSMLNVEGLLRQIIAERPEFQSPNAEIEIQSPLEPVLGHEAYLTQCITNLLDNAVKFMPPGKQPRIRIWSEPSGDQVRFWFEDNGIGIPKEAQERVFGIFQRIHDEKTYRGTGIGLAIVHKAIQRMGGALGVESEPGKGSRFWVELPRGK